MLQLQETEGRKAPAATTWDAEFMLRAQITNLKSTAGSTISTIGTTVTRGIGGNGSSLLPEYRQRKSSVWGNEQGPTVLQVFLWDGRAEGGGNSEKRL